jgi:MFS family permease
MTGAHDPARAADTERPERWLVLVAAIVAQATFSAAYFGLPSIGSEIAAADDLTLGEVGLVLSAPLFGMLLSVAAVGVAADRYGERIVIGGGLALAALALLGASTADGPLGLAAWLALAGAFGATAAIGGRAAAAWFSDADRAFAVSARQSAPMLGAAAGALVLPSIAVALSVPHVFVTLALACGAGALIAAVFLRRPPDRPRTAEGARPGARSVLRNRAVIALAGAAALLQLTGVSLIGFTSILLVQELDWSVLAAGVLLAAALLVAAGGLVVSGWIAGRAGSRVAVVRALAVAAGGATALLALATAAYEPAVALAASLAIVVAASGNGVSAGAVSERVPFALVGTALGVRMTATLTANAIAPVGFGVLLGVVGWSVGLALLVVPALAAVAVLSLPVLASRPAVPDAPRASEAG